jgi:hypothetical protein
MDAWTKIQANLKSPDSFTVASISKLPNIVSSTYNHIPHQIREQFESEQNNGIETHVDLLSRKAHIYILAPGNSADFKPEISKMVAWLNYVSVFADSKCSKDLHIYVLLTNNLKQLPDTNDEPIDTIHANTAFTTSCSAENEIFIFRREEWFKVFLHETFHCLGLDFSSSNELTVLSNKYILSKFPILAKNTDVRLYETYCEVWAEIYSLLFHLFLKIPFHTSKFNEALKKEQEFSLHQSNKLLRRAGFIYADIFELLSPDSKPYSENTNAFSYYILKSSILWNLDGFIQWCLKENNPSTLQFNKTKINKYCEFVYQCMANEKYRKMAKHMKPLRGQFNRKTLRMTWLR